MTAITVLVMLFLAASPALSSFIGELCIDDRDCVYEHSECIHRFDECEEKACWCKKDYGGRFSSSCRRELGTSERCYDRDARHCPDDSSCDTNILDRCVPRILAGSVCTSGTCTSSAHCNTATTPYTCSCYSGYNNVGGKCVPSAFGATCTGACESNYECSGTPLTCQCRTDTPGTSTHKQITVSTDDTEWTVCVHNQATTNVVLGGACRRTETNENAKICNAGLTCSRCLAEDAPTCITPGGGADGVKAGFFILSAAFLLTKLM